jgi:hypothetical protein
MHWIDPDHSPETTGVVDGFLVNGEDEAGGLVLQNGTELRFLPHLGNYIPAAVRLGPTVSACGLRPHGTELGPNRVGLRW